MLLLTGCGSGNAGFSGKNLPEGEGRAAETTEADGALQEASREFFAIFLVPESKNDIIGFIRSRKY